MTTISTLTHTLKNTYQILDDLSVSIEIVNNPFEMELNHLFTMASRINKKRSFLFVSTVLGKHIAVDPHIPLLVGKLLGMHYVNTVHQIQDQRMESVVNAICTKEKLKEVLVEVEEKRVILPRPITFIGFAETATALGHTVFSTFDHNAKYIHTTREQIKEMTTLLNFEEEHSHATSHRVYASDTNFFNDESEIVLIDDEITTGKTALNFIRSIKQRYPQKKTFTVVSILDWRTEHYRKAYKELEVELNITINTISLVEGSLTVQGLPKLESEFKDLDLDVEQQVSYINLNEMISDSDYEYVTSINANGTVNTSPYLYSTGRFGLDISEEQKSVFLYKKIGDYLKSGRKGGNTLVIGTGEFMYVPMKIASEMGTGISFHSTTRSPIYVSDRLSYAIQQKYTFESPENRGLVNYLYNIELNQYDEIFIFVERVTDFSSLNELVQELKKTKIPYIHLVTMSPINR